MNAAQLLLLGIQIANAISAGIPAALRAKAAIEQMVAEGRNPTDAEWAEIDAITAGLRARLHDAGGADEGSEGVDG